MDCLTVSAMGVVAIYSFFFPQVVWRGCFVSHFFLCDENLRRKINCVVERSEKRVKLNGSFTMFYLRSSWFCGNERWANLHTFLIVLFFFVLFFFLKAKFRVREKVLCTEK